MNEKYAVLLELGKIDEPRELIRQFQIPKNMRILQWVKTQYEIALKKSLIYLMAKLMNLKNFI